jgi:hypothetical protein
MPGRIRAGLVGLGLAGVAVLGLVAPAAGERGGGDRMQAGDIAADCEQASMNTPRDGAGGVELTADVVDGATVAPGDEIRFRLTWDPAKWSGQDLERALACVRVKGLLDRGLSGEEGPTANDGVFEYRLQIPENIRPDCDVCVEGFLAGLSADGDRQQLRSERLCFMSGKPRPPTPPATNPPAPETPTTTAAPVLAPPPVEIPTEVRGVTASNPALPVTATPPPAAAAPTAELPRTGSAGRAGAAGGGLFLALGGLAVIGGAGRSRRRLMGV